jgi:hypothetical protein
MILPQLGPLIKRQYHILTKFADMTITTWSLETLYGYNKESRINSEHTQLYQIEYYTYALAQASYITGYFWKLFLIIVLFFWRRQSKFQVTSCESPESIKMTYYIIIYTVRQDSIFSIQYSYPVFRYNFTYEDSYFH